MAYFGFYPQQQQAEFNSHPRRDILADAILAGLSQGMHQFGQSFGPYHRSTPGYRCGGAEARRARCHPSPQQGQTGGRNPQESKGNCKKSRNIPPEAWVWWLLGGGEDSSDSEEEQQSAAPSSRPECRGRRCNVEESCPMKRKPSRSASNAPPRKRTEEAKPTSEKTEKFNFTGKKTTPKDEQKDKPKSVAKREEKTEAEVVFVRRAPWRHVVNLDSELGPEDVKVYVRDGRIRVEGRKERNVGGNDDVIECLEVNRELAVPNDVILDDLSVYFRSGGRLELEAPRKTHETTSSPELVKNLEKMSVEDIEKDVLTSETPTVEDEEETMSQDEESSKEDEAKVDQKTKNDEDSEREDYKQKDEESQDWEMVAEEKAEESDISIIEDEGTTTKITQEVNTTVKETLEDAAKEVPYETEDNKQDSVKISEIEEITTSPIVEEPNETEKDVVTTTEQEPSNLVIRIVSEDQQEKQIEENTQLLVMNLAGFEPRDVTVEMTQMTSEGQKVSVRAVRVQEDDGFISRRENSRICRVPEHLQGSPLTCTMGPEANLVITAPTQ